MTEKYTRNCGELKSISKSNSSNMQYQYVWLVKDLLQCYKSSGIEHAHMSPPFTIGSKYQFEWTLDMYVAGYNREYSDYIGMCPFLNSDYNREDPKFTVEISLLTKDDEVKLTRKVTLNYKNINTSDGTIKDFVLRRDLWNKSGWLPNDELKIDFKIRIGEPNISDEIIALQRTYESSQKTLEKLWECRQFSDFKLIVEKKEFCVHRAILAAASPVFQAMFESKMRESDEGKAIIEDIEANVMEKTLYFIYVNKLNDPEDSADKILAVAEKYQLDSLKQLCENTLAKRLCVDNIYETLLLAEQNNAETLEDQAIEFFLKNAKKLYTNAANFKTSIEMLPINLQTEIICAFVANL